MRHSFVPRALSMLLSGSSTRCGCAITLLGQRLIFTGYLLLKRVQYGTHCVRWYTVLTLGVHQHMSWIFINLSPSRHSVQRLATLLTVCLSYAPYANWSASFPSLCSRRGINSQGIYLPCDVRCVSTTLTLLSKKPKNFLLNKYILNNQNKTRKVSSFILVV